MRVRLFLMGVLVVASTAACADQRICGSDEYPVKAVGNTTGAACVPEGEEPPAGYVKYPEGKVPERVGDEWDRYWSSVVVDEKGAVVSG
ncbi:SCO0607 family lipoprotein [Jidongwangia harbinensis]|uniref:SCO0607 family lipoprotein n=1 Tax=Jidongwangia harbinensis TaxID=2878561 RepID=UPI001CDA52F3|nr:hypothetical protein [Jidongwangia harbinensis]MCA2213326.1 hypothetical protein [Jidongwangia harbinensis]